MRTEFTIGGLKHSLIKEKNGYGLYQLTLKGHDTIMGYHIGKEKIKKLKNGDIPQFIFLKSAYTLSSAEDKLEIISN